MQIIHFPKNIYRFYAYARTQECLDAYRMEIEDSVRKWEELRADGLSEAKCAKHTGISKATYYRRRARLEALNSGEPPPSKAPRRRNKPQWGEAERQLVRRIRRENPTWGKIKIATVLRRDHGLQISDSTVGRILTHLKEKGLVTRSRACPHPRRRRVFNGHARRWTYKDYKKMAMGERVQIDHMSATKNGVTVKHFQAWERKSKHIYANVFSNAKASSARKFLSELLETAPYKLLSIQVDGGSEFEAEFEEACEDLGIPLEVLPPASPKYNGGVERGNRTFREDFYRDPRIQSDSVGALRYDLRKCLEKYNTYRPHQHLNNLTPMEYIKSTQAEAA